MPTSLMLRYDNFKQILMTQHPNPKQTNFATSIVLVSYVLSLSGPPNLFLYMPQPVVSEQNDINRENKIVLHYHRTKRGIFLEISFELFDSGSKYGEIKKSFSRCIF